MIKEKVQKAERKAIDKVLILLGLVATAALLVIGRLAWYGYDFATGMVQSELSAQKIYFPQENTKELTSLPEEDREEVQKYAGQQLTNGDQARVYANHYIGSHLKHIAGGKTYAEVSAQALQDPSNVKLQQQKNTLFQGETLRGILLGTGYSYWIFGMIAKYVALTAFAGAVLMAILVMLGLKHLRKLK